MSYRTILAAPGVGMVKGTYAATATSLTDRKANGDAFPGERVVRVPRRFARDRHRRRALAYSEPGCLR